MCKALAVDLPRESADVLRDPTRARLFELLSERRRPAATDELAEDLGMHVNGIRRQLDRLQRAGLVDRRRVVHGRGRPRDEWSISPEAEPAGEQPTGYAELSRWLTRAIPPSTASLRQLEHTGREIGREMAPAGSDDIEATIGEAFTALGFRPSIETTAEGFICSLGNCPYRELARENPEVICTLHRGLTAGLLAGLDPAAELSLFEPRDPDRAGCLVGVALPDRA